MNGAHVHLTVNDVPILAAFTAAVLLTVALLARSRDVWARAGLLALLVATAGGAFAFLSGVVAVDTVAGMARTSNKALSQHHVRATIASVVLALAAVFGLVVYVRARKTGGRFGRRSLAVVLATTLAAAAALAWTGLAGGRVNHPELQHPSDLAEGPAHQH